MSTTDSVPAEQETRLAAGAILSRSERGFLFVLATGIAIVMAIAVWLTPGSERGLGLTASWDYLNVPSGVQWDSIARTVE